MKRVVGFYAVGMAISVLLPGCGKVIDWGKSNFYQGPHYNTYENQVKPFIQTVTLYDQFSTKAQFDALFLSDAVRTAYSDLHGERMAKSPEHTKAFLRRQLEENEHYISFYILALYGLKLGTPESHWTFALRVDDAVYTPIEIKLVELPYEYQILFGKLFNRFKEPYHLRFNRYDLENNTIISADTRTISLQVRSATTGHTFSWNLRSHDDEHMHTQEIEAQLPEVTRVPRKKRKGRKQ